MQSMLVPVLRGDLLLSIVQAYVDLFPHCVEHQTCAVLLEATLEWLWCMPEFEFDTAVIQEYQSLLFFVPCVIRQLVPAERKQL